MRSLPRKGVVLGLLPLVFWVDTFCHKLVNASPRAYPLGCSTEDPSYYDYENAPFPPPGVPVKSTDDYNLLERLGNGKFSDVFSAIEVGRNKDIPPMEVINPQEDLVVIKCLKPVTDRKIRRELLVLSHASKLPNLARLEALVLHPQFYESQRSPHMLPRMPSFVLKHAGTNTQFLCHPATTKNHPGNNGGGDYLSEYEIKYFLYHLLVALDALHSKGIMHRDVKPRNILITREAITKSSSSSAPSLMLIDLGLADFYFPNTHYNVRVASRHYKAPELLVGDCFYDYGVDLWPVGCILAGTLFRREPFFRGKDNNDQLHKIVSVLGTADLITYIRRIQQPLSGDTTTTTTTTASAATTTPTLSPTICKLLTASQQQQQQQQGRVPWMSFLRAGCPVPSGDGLDLLDKLLVYDHTLRLTAREAMAHPFFDQVRDRVKCEIAAWEQQQQQQSQTS